MIKIKIISVGKTKEPWLEQAIEEYVKRLKPVATVEFIWVKNDDDLVETVLQEPCYICLDPKGKQYTSEQFSQFFQKKFVEGGSRVAFVIGGAEGLPKQLKSGELLSLSLATFTHQITRLILLEQIYRAFEIIKGSRYHK